WPSSRTSSSLRAWPSSATSLRCSRTTFDPAELERRASALETQMQEPGFWDDQKRAASVSAEHSRTTRKRDSFHSLESEIADLEGLAELAQEDDSLASELGDQLTDLERRLDELEEERLFQGPYDAGGAVVSVHSGAGGTDSQDSAEMLLRMYLPWAQ